VETEINFPENSRVPGKKMRNKWRSVEEDSRRTRSLTRTVEEAELRLRAGQDTTVARLVRIHDRKN